MPRVDQDLTCCLSPCPGFMLSCCFYAGLSACLPACSATSCHVVLVPLPLFLTSAIWMWSPTLNFTVRHYGSVPPPHDGTPLCLSGDRAADGRHLALPSSLVGMLVLVQYLKGRRGLRFEVAHFTLGLSRDDVYDYCIWNSCDSNWLETSLLWLE